ncbi:MAG: GtrA family protein [Burkholderiales bacterium]|nr:GtrA family protein [Burkholderiales bacterium]
MSVRKQLPSFILVGATAALVHWCTFTLFVHLGLNPVWVANPCAFFIAFSVSYLGQRNLTFKAGDVPHSKALPRYFLVAVFNFCVNDILLSLCQHYLPLPPEVDMAFILVIVAVLSYLAGRHWAFSRHR